MKKSIFTILVLLLGSAFSQEFEVNGNLRVDDLKLNNIFIEDGGDGVFNNDDYVLFYAKGPHSWEFNGEIESGVQSLEELANLSEYKSPVKF